MRDEARGDVMKKVNQSLLKYVKWKTQHWGVCLCHCCLRGNMMHTIDCKSPIQNSGDRVMAKRAATSHQGWWRLALVLGCAPTLVRYRIRVGEHQCDCSNPDALAL